MNRILSRCSISVLSGAMANTALATLGYDIWNLILGVAVGVAYSAGQRPTRRAYVDNLMAGGSLGVPQWGLINVIAIPLLSGQMPEWNAEMRQHFPALVGWVVYGASLGIINQALNDFAAYLFGLEPVPKLRAVFSRQSYCHPSVADLPVCVPQNVWKRDFARTFPSALP